MSDPQSIRKPQVRTSAQTMASNPETSVWVSANAGTGKTHVLTDRITRLLLSGVKPERILCLTFTKAAAAEMATRLSDRLGSWAVADDAGLKEELTALLGKPPGDGLLAPARRLFAETLDVPGGLKIRTIHAFCESLLGRFPIEAGIAPHFSVIDERTAAELMAEARDRLLISAGTAAGDVLSEALALMAALLNEDDFTQLMTELAFRRAHLKNLFQYHGSPEGVVDAARRVLGIGEDETAAKILADASDDTTYDKDALLGAAEALSGGTKTDVARAAALRDWLNKAPADRTARFQSDYADIFLTKEGSARARLMTNKIAEADPKGLQALLDEQQRIVDVSEKLRALDILTASRALILIGGRLLDAFETLKRNRALLDYDDLILKTHDLLAVDNGVSWVHYKLDGGLDHVLVDEAQDTSPEQWAVIKALSGDFFTGEGAHDQDRTVFAVGDEKQSIYSFQGADPYMFGHTRNHFAEHAKAAGKSFQPVELVASYRSTEAVLKTVDAVFGQDQARQGLTFDDKPIKHIWERKGQAGQVELWPTEKPGDVLEMKPWDAPLDRQPVDSPEDRVAGRIAETIKGWLELEEELPSAGRPIREGDIMILVRRRGSFAEKMVNALKKRRIAVAGADRMILSEQLAVMDLLALGRFLLLPEDDLTLAVVLKGPLFGFTDNDDLFPLAYGRKGSLWQALKEGALASVKFADAFKRLSALLARADYMPPFEFFARLLGPEGGRRALLERLGDEADDPIDEFLNLALDYEREHVPSLQGFLSWIEAGETQIKRDLEQGHGDVRVMTIHGSKGLQGNIVFLPDTCTVPSARQESKLRWISNPEPALLWAPSKAREETLTASLSEEAKHLRDQEYRRLLYVALTRARDRLYISGWEGKNAPPENCWYNLIEPVMRDLAEQTTAPTGQIVLRLVNPQTEPPDGGPKTDVDGAPELSKVPDWALNPPRPEPEPTTPLTPSKMSDEAEPSVRSPFDGDDGSRFKRGLLIHRLLESLPALPAPARARVAAAYLARPVHGLEEAQQRALAKEAMALLENPDFAPLFDNKSLAEVPISGLVKGRAVSARIDRLRITDTDVTIIDYKTNRPPPENPELVAPAYLQQMALYRVLLSDIYPERKIRCILVWTDGPRMMALDDDLMDRHAP